MPADHIRQLRHCRVECGHGSTRVDSWSRLESSRRLQQPTFSQARLSQLSRKNDQLVACQSAISRVVASLELVQDGTISVDTCHDPDQTADILMKALPRPKHAKHVEEMGLAPA